MLWQAVTSFDNLTWFGGLWRHWRTITWHDMTWRDMILTYSDMLWQNFDMCWHALSWLCQALHPLTDLSKQLRVVPETWQNLSKHRQNASVPVNVKVLTDMSKLSVSDRLGMLDTIRFLSTQCLSMALIGLIVLLLQFETVLVVLFRHALACFDANCFETKEYFVGFKISPARVGMIWNDLSENWASPWAGVDP